MKEKLKRNLALWSFLSCYIRVFIDLHQIFEEVNTFLEFAGFVEDFVIAYLILMFQLLFVESFFFFGRKLFFFGSKTLCRVCPLRVFLQSILSVLKWSSYACMQIKDDIKRPVYCALIKLLQHKDLAVRVWCITENSQICNVSYFF